jgi:purine-binding chemotaxis protein CheW
MKPPLYVVFRVGDAEYVVSAAEVVQMESFTGATKVPGTAPYVAGLVHIRATVVPVIDLRTRFGLPSVPRTIDSRVVVVRLPNRSVGLIVDSAREVVRIADQDFAEPPEVIARQADGFVKAVTHGGARILMLLDLSKLIGEEPIHVQPQPAA